MEPERAPRPQPQRERELSRPSRSRWAAAALLVVVVGVGGLAVRHRGEPPAPASVSAPAIEEREDKVLFLCNTIDISGIEIVVDGTSLGRLWVGRDGLYLRLPLRKTAPTKVDFKVVGDAYPTFCQGEICARRTSADPQTRIPLRMGWGVTAMTFEFRPQPGGKTLPFFIGIGPHDRPRMR